jgi:hypothetical protein
MQLMRTKWLEGVDTCKATPNSKVLYQCTAAQCLVDITAAELIVPRINSTCDVEDLFEWSLHALHDLERAWQHISA